jgi:hypothetical protein
MSAANLYKNAVLNAFKGNIKIGTNTIKCGLLKSTHTLDLDADDTWSDVSSDEASGTNYSAGGVTLGTPALTTTAANSWSTTAATSTAYVVGDVVRPATGNGYLYRAEAAGTSSSSAPTWPTTIGATVTDGTVVWTCMGTGIVQFTCDAVTFSDVTISDFEILEFYDSTSGYLIAAHDVGSAQDVSATNVTYTPDALGVAWFFVA